MNESFGSPSPLQRSHHYLLDIPSLRPGDIVLTTSFKPSSAAIRRVTDSGFSHVMLYVGHALIHAEPAGVFSKNPQRHLRTRKEHIRVFRYPSLQHETAQAICGFARSKTGSLYSKREALRSVAGTPPGSARSAQQFCSRLVAQAFDSAGIRLVQNPDYCVPGEFDGSPALEEITSAVRQATPEEIAYSKTPDKVLEHQRDTFRWLKRARTIAHAKRIDLQTMNDVLTFLAAFPEYDAAVMKAIRKTGYLGHRERDRQVNPYRYDPMMCMAVLQRQEIPPRGYLTAELAREHRDLRYGHELARYQAAPDSLEYVHQHKLLYRALLGLSHERCQVLAIVAGFTGHEDLAMDAMFLGMAFRGALDGPGAWEELARRESFPNAPATRGAVQGHGRWV